MKRKKFLLASLATLPAIASAPTLLAASRSKTPFVVDAGKPRQGEPVKFMGVHPNELKISSRDTDGELSVFEYIGLAKTGPPLHVHFEQDEIFYIVEGEYRFAVGEKTLQLKAGDTVFLPRNIPHTWLQLTDHGKLIYFLQPAGKMEEFFAYMNKLTTLPSPEEMEKVHRQHNMSVVGPPLTL